MPVMDRKKNAAAKVAKKKPVHLKTWKEARAYLDEHLTPVRFGPKGQPIYSHEDIEKLDIILPDEL